MTTIQQSGYGESEIIRVKAAGIRPYEIYKFTKPTLSYMVAFRGETGQGLVTETFEVTREFFEQAASAAALMRETERQVGALTLAMQKSKRAAAAAA